MRHRASNITKILSLFRQANQLDLSDIAGALLIAPSDAKAFCQDLIKSGMLLETGSVIDPTYIATEKLVSTDNHIYEMIGEVFDGLNESSDIIPMFQDSDFTCVMSVSGFCGPSHGEVPCEGIESFRKRCYNWVK